MKVARVSVALSALLVAFGTVGAAVASPQSMLDPYANIKPPSAKEKLAPPAPNGKPAKVAPMAAQKAFKATKKETPITSSNDQGDGFMAGTKEIFHGIGTATKGAASGIVHPMKVLGGGVVNGGKKVTGEVGGGVKAAGEKVKDTTVKTGHAVSVVPKKMGEGIMAAGHGMFGFASKTGEGAKKVASAPLKLAGRLNPFHHKDSGNVATASNTDRDTK